MSNLELTFTFCLDFPRQGSRQDRSSVEHLSVVSVSQHSEVAWQWSSFRQNGRSRLLEDCEEVVLQNQGAGPSQSPVFGLQKTPSHLKMIHFESCKKCRNSCHLRLGIETVFVLTLQYNRNPHNTDYLCRDCKTSGPWLCSPFPLPVHKTSNRMWRHKLQRDTPDLTNILNAFKNKNKIKT